MRISTLLPLTIPEEEAEILASEAFLSGILIFLLIFLFFTLIFAVVTVIFQGIGIMKMHEKLGLKNGWMAFVPFLNAYAIGKVAEQYVKADGRKSAKFSVILVVANSIYILISMVSLFFNIFTTFAEEMAVSPEAILTVSAISLVFAFFELTFSCAYMVVSYVAWWRVFAIFSNKNATLYLILSIFVSVVHPFLVFAIRNNDPMNVEIKVEEIPEAVEV